MCSNIIMSKIFIKQKGSMKIGNILMNTAQLYKAKDKDKDLHLKKLNKH